jgi:hypothetical protein
MSFVRALCDEVLRSGHFYLAPALKLEQEYVDDEDDLWEVFQGHLLDRRHSRQRRTFAAWNVYLRERERRSGEPLLSLKLDAAAGELHVVRAFEAEVTEGYDAGGGVIETRDCRRWVRELVGTIRLNEFATPDDLRDELACRLFLAVVGTSRLPLHSLDAPLVEFSFGRLFYRYRHGVSADTAQLGNLADLADSAEAGWTDLEYAKQLETCLHAQDVVRVAQPFAARQSAPGCAGADLVRILRTLFNEISLSPWTDIAGRTLAFLTAWESTGVLSTDQVTDFLAHLLRQIGRHLTAYDLVTFHHRGANYPDALLLDAILKAYLERVNRRPDAFLDTPADNERTSARKRLRRRALRQGWILRQRYQGHPVPDAPTSPGESARILPAEYPRVPKEQILQPGKRKKRLFLDSPLASNLAAGSEAALRQSVTDLEQPSELRELGLALYLDRPLGDAKQATEPDATLLLASEAFSPSVAASRLVALSRQGLLSEADRDALTSRLQHAEVARGVPLQAIGQPRRPGMVSLTDAKMMAPDFAFQRTVPGGVRTLLEMFDFGELTRRFDLGWLTAHSSVLVARTPNNTLALYDHDYRRRLEFAVSPGGYKSRAGIEWPVAGLIVLEVVDTLSDGLRVHDLRASPAKVAAAPTGAHPRVSCDR